MPERAASGNPLVSAPRFTSADSVEQIGHAGMLDLAGWPWLAISGVVIGLFVALIYRLWRQTLRPFDGYDDIDGGQ